MVDKNYVEGAVENAAGKVEEAAGYVTGSPGARIEGKVRQVAGKAQAAYGRAAEEVSTQLQDATKHRPFAALLVAGAVGFALGRMSVHR
ncbi:MAG TPA: CsbD family protein [Candidatus Binataceae bacterium]|jgi:uncharacterized protein YjbJ (UPF0337 family)|nr:CsbD family protein [Candidatus Binataceae bacterium]